MEIKKFLKLSLEKKFIIMFFWICVALPFCMARSPVEIFSHSIPMWINFYAGTVFWHISGKPLWQAFLACYGVASMWMISFSLGAFGGQILFVKLINWIRSRLGKRLIISFRNPSLILKIGHSYQKFDSFGKSRKKRFAEWLSRQSIAIILFVLVIPLPASNNAAAIAMTIKKVKYGLWYALASNVLRMYIIVWLIYTGSELFFL